MLRPTIKHASQSGRRRTALSRGVDFCTLLAVCALTSLAVTFAHALSEAAQPPSGAARLPPDLFEQLQVGKATMQNAASVLGVPRSTIGDVAIYSVGGYQISLVFSLDQKKTGFPPGVLLGIGIEIERPARVKDFAPIKLGGYWTPSGCDGAACETGSSKPLHASRLQDLGLKGRCSPSLLGGQKTVRFHCSGTKANNLVDVDVDASLGYGLDPELAPRAERASLMMEIKAAEDDPNNPDRTSSQGLRQRYGINGPITGDTIWTLLQDLPVSGYHLTNTTAVIKQR